MADLLPAEFWTKYGPLLLDGTVDTLVMTGISTVFAYLLGLPLGVALILTQPHGIRPNNVIYKVLGWIINVGRKQRQHPGKLPPHHPVGRGVDGAEGLRVVAGGVSGPTPVVNGRSHLISGKGQLAILRQFQ